jgi:hypothetical protein
LSYNLKSRVYLRNIWKYFGSRVSSGSIVSDYGLDDRAIGVRSRQRIFPLTSVSKPALGPTQPPVQWVPGVLSRGVKRGRGVMLTTHPHLVPRSWMSRSYTSSPPSASMAYNGTDLLYFTMKALHGIGTIPNYKHHCVRFEVVMAVKMSTLLSRYRRCVDYTLFSYAVNSVSVDTYPEVSVMLQYYLILIIRHYLSYWQLVTLS